MQGLRCPFSSLRAPGSVTHNSKDVSPSRAARKLSRRPGWSQPAAPRLQVAGQRRGRLSGQGPRLCHSAPGDPGVGSTRGSFCHSPTPWSASRVSRGSACARVFKPPAGESTRGKESDGPASPRKGCREWEEAGAIPGGQQPGRCCSSADNGLLSLPYAGCAAASSPAPCLLKDGPNVCNVPLPIVQCPLVSL